jgi:hypothetical protein
MIRMTTKITKTIDHSADILAAIAQFKKRQVMVGVPAEKAARSAEAANGTPINNAALAFIHNYGMPSLNIPARPFLETGIADVQGKINEKAEKAIGAAFDGNREAVEKGLIAMGIVAVSGVQLKIKSGPFVPLKPATLAARRRRGHSGTKPLIEFGELLRSINFVVRNKV